MQTLVIRELFVGYTWFMQYLWFLGEKNIWLSISIRFKRNHTHTHIPITLISIYLETANFIFRLKFVDKMSNIMEIQNDCTSKTNDQIYLSILILISISCLLMNIEWIQSRVAVPSPMTALFFTRLLPLFQLNL